ncbi:MAG: PAS domain S-box protein [Thermodesulfobacteriota bacterium]
MVYIDLIHNLALLVALSIVSGFIEKRWPRQTRSGVLLQGLLFGMTAVLGMLRPVNLGPGLIFDGRSIMVSLCALFFGPWAASLAGTLTVACRLWMGGSGTLTGTLVIISSAMIGLLARHYLKPETRPLSASNLYLFGIAVHLAMIALMFTLPEGAGPVVAKRIAPPVMLLYPLATILAGKILRDQVEAGRQMAIVRESMDRFRHVFESANVGKSLTLPTGEINVNKAFADFLGYTPEELKHKKWQDLTPEDEIEKTEKTVAALLAGENDAIRFEKSYIHKNGERLWADVSVTLRRDADNKPLHFITTVVDISQRKHAEEELEKSNQRLTQLLEVARELALAANTGDVIRIIRQAARALSNADGVTVVLRDGDNCFYVDEDAIEPLWKGKKFPMKDCISGWVMRNAQYVAIEDIYVDPRIPHDVYRATFVKSLAMAPIRTEDPIGAIGAYWRDHHQLTGGEKSMLVALGNMTATVWETIEARDALRRSEETLRAVFENMQDGILMADAVAQIFVFANKAIGRMLGYPLEQILTFGLSDIHPPEALPHVKIAFERQLSGQLPVATDIPMMRRDGSVFIVEVNAAPLEINGRAYLLGIFRDMTERKRAETERDKLQSQLVQSQKMESVGRLAGGVAHDFNNMLNVIIGFAELSIENITPGDFLHENLNEILDAARRSAEITRQLLAFARKQIISPRPLDLNETVEGMLRMLRRLIGEDIDLAWKPRAGLWPIMMDPSQIDQILANLLVNARDAISGVGKITLETENVNLDENYCDNRVDFVPGDYVMLAVSDNGRGMDKETLGNLFEPFFTTKSADEGTGLGLSTVYGIVKQNNGVVNVYSEPGQGATFKIYLPRYTGKAEKIEEVKSEIIPRGKGETILIVEDEAAVLKLAGKVLTGLGYNVIKATSPEAALKMAEENSGTIDLLMTDVIMPEMNGRELAERLRVQYPGLKIMFMSGYTANVIAHHGILDKGVHFIQKPFSKQDLALKVREALLE